MTEARKIGVELGEELAKDIDMAVACGDYADAEAVMRDALDLWQKRRQAYIQRLRDLWEEGINSGEPKPFTDEVWKGIIERGKARAASIRSERDAA